jgi:glucose-1-phosphate adenylyltransferase
MKTRAIILAGGEGTRLSMLTTKRAKPAVPFGGKYRVIDFALSNCVNSRLFDVMILAQYRPHSLVEHLGSGGPWDLDRDFTGGLRILTPYRARGSDWYAGTADAVQQNFTFIKRGEPDLILVLSGDHIYKMDYDALIRSHIERKAELTIATIQVPLDEASRYGILNVDDNLRVTSFVEKPAHPQSTLANMGVYVFNRDTLDQLLWQDHLSQDSAHDFGKNILPALISSSDRVYTFPFHGYWIDIGTTEAYWQAHMDLLPPKPNFDLYDRSWVIHTRSEERPPARIHSGAEVVDSLICDGCEIEKGATVIRSVLSPGVIVPSGCRVEESILLTDTHLGNQVSIRRAILDKLVQVGDGVTIGEGDPESFALSMVGRQAILPPGLVVEPGGVVGHAVIPSDYAGPVVGSGEYVQTRRLPYEV